MPAPTFEKTSTLTFTYGNDINDTESLNFNDTVYRTIGGVSVVESFGNPIKRKQFSTGAMTESERDDLINFITNEIFGRSEVFTYTDRDSNSFTVRLLDESVEFSHKGPLYFETSMLLEVIV